MALATSCTHASGSARVRDDAAVSAGAKNEETDGKPARAGDARIVGRTARWREAFAALAMGRTQGAAGIDSHKETTMMSKKHELPALPPWLSWLPRGVEFVRDGQGQVCALRAFNAGAPVDLELGAVTVRAKADTPVPGKIEWTVHASVSRHCEEAKAALSVIQYTLVMLEGLQKELVKELGKRTVAPERRREFIERERSILGFVVGAFLLVDPLCHPDLASLYHPKILRLVRRMPDLHGHLHLPAPPDSDPVADAVGPQRDSPRAAASSASTPSAQSSRSSPAAH